MLVFVGARQFIFSSSLAVYDTTLIEFGDFKGSFRTEGINLPAAESRPLISPSIASALVN